MAGNVPDLSNALSIFGVVLSPIVERALVEVLSAYVDALLGQQLVDVIGQPGTHCSIPQIEQSVFDSRLLGLRTLDEPSFGRGEAYCLLWM